MPDRDAEFVPLNADAAPPRSLEDALTFLSHDAREGHASTLALLELQRIRSEPMAMAELVERIERNARRSLVLIDDFVEIARAHGRMLDVDEFDLVDELADVVANAWLTATARGVRVRMAPGPDAAPCKVDRDMLNAALTKLVRDASAKAARGDEVVCGLVQAGAGWTIEICEADRADDAPDTTAGEAGVALARIVVVRHLGKFEVQRSPGGQRVLRLTLPAMPV